MDAGTIPLPATRSSHGASQDTSDELADSDLVPLTPVPEERCLGDSPMHTNDGANLPSATEEVSGGTWATTTGN